MVQRLLVLLFLVYSSTLWAKTPSPQIPQDNPTTKEKIELGRILYFDKRLSKDNSLSCNSCHDLNSYGDDGLPTSTGIKGQKGGRNAPTVFNAAFISTQFWDARAKTLEEQAGGPIINPVEMGMPDHKLVVQKLKKVKGYKPYFKKAFPKNPEINIENITKAIGAYERTLITYNSPYDKYLAGDKKAMSELALKGMNTFNNIGCNNCHSGQNFSGPDLPLGTPFLVQFPSHENRYIKRYELDKDTGRAEATKKDTDKHLWRVPTLRNVAETAPYFHNGKVKDLETAVTIMAKTQLNEDLSAEQKKQLVAFLKSLTGTFPKVVEPKMPQ